jgi:predicted dehydrogenase
MKVPIAIVGCGGMGRRHLNGILELHEQKSSPVELAAVCDLRRDNAENLAADAEKLLGGRPLIFSDLEEMKHRVPDLQAVIITTDAGSHHKVACQAFDLGLHVLCEKPLGLTPRACNLILAAQQRSGKYLSVAENYRRDPMSRLTRALIDSGTIGDLQLYIEAGAGSGNQILITPWRHKKESGGMLLDGGVHNADMMFYSLGDVQQVFAKVALFEKIRYKPENSGALAGFYDRWQAEMPDSIEATAEDTLVSVIQFSNGTLGQWTQSYAAHGKGFGHKVIYGSKGSLIPGGIRNGISPSLSLDNREELSGEGLLEFVPEFHLDQITARLFAAERLSSFNIPFPSVDRKLLAIEIFELADCILNGRTPEVDGRIGRRAVALCFAAFESSRINQPVPLDEIENEKINSYSREIDQILRI